MGTASSLTSEQAAVWRSYSDMSRDLFTALERELVAAASVSIPEFELLDPLLDAGADGLRATELATAARWLTSRVSHQVRRLEQRGLVERRPHPADRRGTVITLTDAGRQAALVARPLHEAAVSRFVFSVLSDDDVRVLEAIARTVLGALSAASAGDTVLKTPCCGGAETE